MIPLNKLTQESLPLLRTLLSDAPHRFADFTAGYQYMWAADYDTAFGIFEEMPLLSASEPDGSRRYACLRPIPVGGENAFLTALCRANGGECAVGALTQEEARRYAAAFSGAVREEMLPEESDYLYLAEPLSSFAGRRLSAKRNHLNAFLREHADFSIRPLSMENMDEVTAFHRRFQQETRDQSETALREEKAATRLLRAFPYAADAGFVLYTENRVIGFSLGELRGDTFYMHVEKADPAIRGAYPCLTRAAVAEMRTAGAVYVNREEDDGDPGLRQSKRSFCPESLLDKYTLYLKA